MSTKEAFYDEHIGPELLRLGQLAEANGFSFAAVVEWLPGETGVTACVAADASFKMRLAEIGATCHGNVDALLIAIERYARQHGHSSIYLQRLGVPPRPEGAAVQ
jgi:hypothetical protein